MKKKSIDLTNIIYDLEYEICKSFYNYKDDNFCYPMHIYNEGYENEQHFLKVGANELHVTDSVARILESIEELYDIDFEKLEETRMDNIVCNGRNAKKSFSVNSSKEFFLTRIDVEKTRINEIDWNNEAMKCIEYVLDNRKPYFMISSLSIKRYLRKNFYNYEEIEYVLENLDYEKWAMIYAEKILEGRKYSLDIYTPEDLRVKLTCVGFSYECAIKTIKILNYCWDNEVKMYVNDTLNDYVDLSYESSLRDELKRELFEVDVIELGVEYWKRKINK